MKFRLPVHSLFAIATLTLWLTACGGGGSTPPTPPAVISVSLSSAPPTSLAISTSTNITAVVSNDSKNGGVNWTVTCSASPCGTFSPTTTASGTATSYTAPSTIPSPATVTVTATSVSDTTKSASATITITAAVTPPITVSLSAAPPTSLAISTSTSITAVVSNDSKNGGVNWTVSCSACGTFSPTATASGVATSYTAPATVPSPATVTVTATSVSDTTKSASATITIAAAPPPISVALNPQPPTSLATSGTASLTAVVSNDSKNGGVNWTVTCGSSACGSFNPAATASAAATVYTAPSAIPTGNTVTVTATSVSDTTKTASTTITIVSVLGDGTYIYNFSGQDSTGFYFVVGAFTVKSGSITAGEQDFSNGSIGSTDKLDVSKCSLSTVGGNIQIVLGTDNSQIGVSGVETLRGTVVSSSRVLISEFDTYAAATGSLDLQTGTAAPTGGYAFAVSGLDVASGNLLGIGGILNINGTTVSTANNSVFDYNNGGTVGQSLSFASGSVSAPDSFGRVTLNLTPSSGLAAFVLTGYIVGTNRIQLVESQNDTLGADLGGTALGQGSNTFNFNAAMLANSSYTYAGAGADVNGLTSIAGVFSFSAAGAVSGSLVLNDISFFGSNTITGTYTVDTTGRVTLSNVIAQPLSPTAPFTIQLYLDGNGNALELGVDTLEVTMGPAYHQTSQSSDFEGNYAIAGAGFLDTSTAPYWGAVGPVTVSSDTFKGYTDYTLQRSTTLYPTTSLSGSENNSTGVLNLSGLNQAAFTTANIFNYYPIDGSRVLAIENDGLQIGLLTLESVSH